ncbi:FecR family protein [Poseidonibacter lekithochrous]|uniref:FecR family protein n=1 Tax=Poseidonibacter lekithochrous TaxID=1904463 RepID=UPI0009FA7180|nr:FecR family protein [Poseidonibacter lekithochrous]QKJ22883.1 sigma factor regulatory protein, FecR family [Poseidonibacter lekithochrous]
MNKVTIQEQACNWLNLKKEKCPTFNNEEFLVWLNEKEEHFSAYKKEEELRKNISAISNDVLKELSSEVFNEIKENKNRKILFKAIIPYSLAASLLLILSFSIFEMFKGPEVLYSKEFITKNKVLTNIKLKDNSIISLDSNTTLKIKYYEKSREVLLKKGKAFFWVKSNRNRPFLINANFTNVEVIGTKFEVSNINNRVDVNVKEGRVKVAKVFNKNKKPRILVLLEKGQKVSLNSNGEIDKLQNINVKSIAPWEQGKLIFKQDSLKNVMYEFSKHLDIDVKFETKKSSLYAITGEFNTNKFDNLLKSLPLIHPISIERTANKILIKEKF